MFMFGPYFAGATNQWRGREVLNPELCRLIRQIVNVDRVTGEPVLRDPG